MLNKKNGKNRICEVIYSRNINIRSANGMTLLKFSRENMQILNDKRLGCLEIIWTIGHIHKISSMEISKNTIKATHAQFMSVMKKFQQFIH